MYIGASEFYQVQQASDLGRGTNCTVQLRKWLGMECWRLKKRLATLMRSISVLVGGCFHVG